MSPRATQTPPTAPNSPSPHGSQKSQNSHDSHHSIDIEFLGRRLRLVSEHPGFAHYVEAAMVDSIISPSTRKPDVISYLRWHRTPPPKGVDAAFPGVDWTRRPDRDLLVAEGQAWWGRIDDFTDLKLQVSITPQELEINGDYYFHIGSNPAWEPVRRWRHRGRLDRIEGHRFSTLLYYLIYHPLLWLASRRQGWHLAHGGAVARGGRALVFVGAPGCGKSTLAVAMLADQRCTLLSDNLFLHNRTEVLGCQELMLLDATSLKLAGRGADRLQATGETRVFGRDAFRCVGATTEAVPPVGICWVERGKKSALTASDAGYLAARMQTGNTLAKEVRRSEIMDQVIDLAASTVAPQAAEARAAFTTCAPCWILTVGPDGEAPALAASLFESGSNK